MRGNERCVASYASVSSSGSPSQRVENADICAIIASGIGSAKTRETVSRSLGQELSLSESVRWERSDRADKVF